MLALLALALLVSSAVAQEDTTGGNIPALNTQFYRIPIDATRTMWADDSTLAPDGYVSGRMSLNYMRSPLGYWPDDSNDYTNIVRDVAHLNLIGAYTFSRFRVGLDLPVNLLTTSDVADSVTGLGDVAMDVKGAILQQDADGLGVAVSTRAILPTATTSDNAALGSPGVAVEFGGIVDKDIGKLRLAFNLGTRFQPRTALENGIVDDQMYSRVGGGYALTENAGLSLDLAGHLNFVDLAVATAPLEAMLGGYGRINDGFILRGGVSRGITPAIGSPLFRGVVLLAWEPSYARGMHRDMDMDMDGIGDTADTCPEQPEDMDGFEDLDGCPDLDNDGDGLSDVDDACPNEAEDVDGHRDDDGCVDPETLVRIRVTDLEDNPIVVRVLITGETFDGELGKSMEVALNPGSYLLGGGAAGYSSLYVPLEVPEQTEPFEARFIMEKEDVLGTVTINVTNPDGAPVVATWQFEGQAERDVGESREVSQAPGDYNVFVRAKGYGAMSTSVKVVADKETLLKVMLQPSRVVMTAAKIYIKEKVFFTAGKSDIMAVAHDLLNEVAILIIDHPELLVVRIEGHTDSRGSASKNLRLSGARAASVCAYLNKVGVSRTRLVSVGLGERRRLDTAENNNAHEMNRRVEFFIESRDDDGDGLPDVP